MSDLVNAEYVTTAPGSGGSNLVVESYVDSGDSITKVLPVSAVMWGTKDGDFFLVNETTPMPVDVPNPVGVELYDSAGNGLISSTSAPGGSDRGLIVRVAGTVAQGTAAAASSGWMAKITDGTDVVTTTTVSSKHCLDVAIVSGAGGGSSHVDDAAFTVGTTTLTVAGGIYKGTRDSVDDSDGGAFAMTAKRALYVTVETTSGDSVLNDTWDSVVHSSAFPTSTTGTIAATGATASQACSGLGTIAMTLDGSVTTLSGNFQLSSDGGTTWVNAVAHRKDTGDMETEISGLAMTSEAISWQIDCKGYTHFRFDTTDITVYSTLNFRFQAIAENFTAPSSGSGGGGGGATMVDDAAFTVGSTTIAPVGGTYRSSRDAVNDNDGGAFAMTSRRALFTAIETPNADSAMDDTDDAVRVVAPNNSVKNIISAASTNSTVAKASAGTLSGYSFTNNSSDPVYLRFYDHGSPTVGSTTVKLGPIMIPPLSGVNSPSCEMKISFSTAISFSLTGGIASADTTAIGADEVCGAVLYR